MNNIGEDPSLGYVDANLWVPKGLVNVEGVKKALTFPIFRGKDREVVQLPLYLEAEHHLVVPREFWKAGMFNFDLLDFRPRKYKKTGIISRILLDHKELDDGSIVPTGMTFQAEALAAMLAARGGTLQLRCGGGKTLISLEAITILQVPALIVIDNMQLLLQWQKAIDKFLDVPGGVGLVGDGVFDWEGRSIVLATYQTLAQKRASLPEVFRRWFGVVIFEESHHLDAPTFSKSADLIYGRRYGLSATPDRDDGLHVIHEFHVGSVFFKYLKQELKPRIYFYWTGLELDMSDPETVANTHTDAGELHLSKLAVWFGRWRKRLELVLGEIVKAQSEGRKILFLSNSVDELVNLLAMYNGLSDLYTDIPTPPSLPYEPPPAKLTRKEQDALQKELERLREKHDRATHATQMEIEIKISNIEMRFMQHEAWRRVSKIDNKAQRDYLAKLLAMPSDAGLMIFKVSPEERMSMLKKNSITFAIMKYGREGLDDKAIDTVMLSSPISREGGIQQSMGRALRFKEGKKIPIYMVFEDNIFPIMAMCKKMRKHMRHWPVSDGGPFEYEFVGYPDSQRRSR